MTWRLSGDRLGPRAFSFAQAESVAWPMSEETLVLMDNGKRCAGERLGDGGRTPFVFPASPRLIWSHHFMQRMLWYGGVVEKDLPGGGGRKKFWGRLSSFDNF